MSDNRLLSAFTAHRLAIEECFLAKRAATKNEISELAFSYRNVAKTDSLSMTIASGFFDWERVFGSLRLEARK